VGLGELLFQTISFQSSSSLKGWRKTPRLTSMRGSQVLTILYQTSRHWSQSNRRWLANALTTLLEHWHHAGSIGVAIEIQGRMHAKMRGYPQNPATVNSGHFIDTLLVDVFARVAYEPP